MITALGTKPNIFHAVRAVKPANTKMWAQGSVVVFQRSTQQSSYFCSESTDQFVFPGFLQKRAGEKEAIISLQSAKNISCSTEH